MRQHQFLALIRSLAIRIPARISSIGCSRLRARKPRRRARECAAYANARALNSSVDCQLPQDHFGTHAIGGSALSEALDPPYRAVVSAIVAFAWDDLDVDVRILQRYDPAR